MQATEGFRLSYQQTRLWLLEQDSPVYRAVCAVLIKMKGKGVLNRERLEHAIQGVMDRHEILRTTFHRLQGMNVPFQVIAEKSSPKWDPLQHRGEQEAQIESLLQQAVRQPFDLEQGPLLHLSLIALSAREHLLLLTLPALCADALTFNHLLYEIFDFYQTNGQDSSLSLDEPWQYADFCQWQHELLEGAGEVEEAEDAEDAEAGRAYWRQQLASSHHALPLERRPDERLQTRFEPASFSFSLDAAISAKIETLVQAYDSSEEVFLLTCWQTLLWRLAGEPNVGEWLPSSVVVGTKFDGANSEELALGPFAQWLPICMHVEEESTPFSAMLATVDELMSEAEAWQDYFSWQESAAEVKGDALFSVGFEFEQGGSSYESDELVFSIEKQVIYSERFKVKLSCVQSDEMTLTFHYDAHLFEAQDITRLAGQFQTLLASVLSNPEGVISQLEILSAHERQQLLVEFNNAEGEQSDYPKETCIHELFAEQAARTPNKVAVVVEEQQLTYAELNRRANQLAHYLIQQGVGADTLVALSVEPSIEMMIGILGILKAGGAYVPLAPILPKERLAFMLEDTQAPVLLTQQHLVQQLPASSAKIVCLDAEWDTIGAERAHEGRNDENPVTAVTSRNLVYVLFTSGSTGQPKAVAVEHQQLVNYVSSIIERLELPAGARFAMVSTFAADLGNTVLFPALCTGGTLDVVSQEYTSDPDALAEYFQRDAKGIDCLKITPSHLSALLSASQPEHVLPRQRLILGGEASSWKLIEKVYHLMPDCQVFNHYGPTETTVGVLTYQVGKEEHRNPALGRPIANTQIYILDRHLQPVPLGVAGELHIGGDCVARGYLNRPELTQERFISNPFALPASQKKARLYKTGDLVRYLPSSEGLPNLSFMGRIDHQVKIRGFRVELGEIEAVLRQHPTIREAAVIAKGAGASQPEKEAHHTAPRLVAYIVPSKGQEIGDLRAYLKQSVPNHMIPAVFISLPTMPLTANGKIDRRALPAPDSAARSSANFVAPRTPTEEQLAAIWRELLGLKQVGIHDNFFELGGHSLLATQVISRIRETFKIMLSLRHLFQITTIAGLAELIEALSMPSPAPSEREVIEF